MSTQSRCAPPPSAPPYPAFWYIAYAIDKKVLHHSPKIGIISQRNVFMNINDYIDEFGDKTFEERPFNEVDSLVFAELASLNFEQFLGWTEPEKTLSDLSVYKKTLIERTYFSKGNFNLIKNAATSTRFQKVKVGWADSYYNEEQIVQFAAFTFRLEDGTAIVSFRGTDESIVGWKEDFNMAFLSEIPAQRLAVEYIEKVAAEEKNKIIVCGHSKGGNLAVYSSVFCNESIKNRIIAIYNHDGPGFNEKIFTKDEYVALKDRMYKFVPHDSLIGILLEHENDYKVVPSKSANIGQHNPFTWKVKDETRFKESGNTTVNSKLVDKAMCKFVNELNDEQRKTFINGLFAVIEGSGAKYLNELKDAPFKRLKGMRKAYSALTGEEKKLMARGGMRFAKLWFKSIVSLKDKK